MKQRQRRRRGIALVEFTLVTPMFLLLCVAAVDFARVFHTMIVLTAATRAGAQYAGQSSAAASDTGGIAAVVANAAGNPAGLAVTSTDVCTCTPGGSQVSCSTTCTGKTSYIKIKTTQRFNAVMGWPGMPSSITMTSAAITRIQ